MTLCRTIVNPMSSLSTMNRRWTVCRFSERQVTKKKIHTALGKG